MKMTEARKLLDKYFSNIIKPLNFKKHRYGFIRQEKDFFIYFSYALFDSDNSFPSQFGLSCGFKSFDKIYGKILGREIVDGSLYSLSQAGLYDEKKYPKLEYDLYTEADIQQMVKEVTEYLEKEALPFFESLNTIEKLEKYRNANPMPQQAKTGLILAKLVGNPDYNNLEEQYRLLLKEWPKNDKQELERVINFLDTHSKEEILKMAVS